MAQRARSTSHTHRRNRSPPPHASKRSGAPLIRFFSPYFSRTTARKRPQASFAAQHFGAEVAPLDLRQCPPHAGRLPAPPPRASSTHRRRDDDSFQYRRYSIASLRRKEVSRRRFLSFLQMSAGRHSSRLIRLPPSRAHRPPFRPGCAQRDDVDGRESAFELVIYCRPAMIAPSRATRLSMARGAAASSPSAARFRLLPQHASTPDRDGVSYRHYRF